MERGRALSLHGSARGGQANEPDLGLDWKTGAKTVWAEFDPSGGGVARRVGNPLVSADGTTVAYTYGILISDLYWVEGLK